jgi:hypothetical protein
VAPVASGLEAVLTIWQGEDASMKNSLLLLAILGISLIAVGPASAQQGEPQIKPAIQIDPATLKAIQDKIGGVGKIDPEMLKKLLDMIGAGVGKIDPEQVSKFIEKLSQGQVKIDPEVFKRLQDKIIQKRLAKLGKIDADALFKKLDADGDGKLTKTEFLKIADEFKAAIGEGQMAFARILLGKRYDELDPDGSGLSLDQFRKEVARFLKEKAGK